MSQYLVAIFQFHAESGAGQSFPHHPLKFDYFLVFCHLLAILGLCEAHPQSQNKNKGLRPIELLSCLPIGQDPSICSIQGLEYLFFNLKSL
jgi:hypothetical protein